MKCRQSLCISHYYFKLVIISDFLSRSIMNDVAKDNRILSIVGRAGLKNMLTNMVDQMQRCQRSLNEYLEEKRDSFPRFYFIGDDDLLEILGQVRVSFAVDHA